MTPIVNAHVRERKGLTVVELVVVLAIMGLLIALLLPAVQGAREAARRAACLSKVRQIGLAAHNYISVHEVFPPGAIYGDRGGNFVSAFVLLIPFLEGEAISRSFNFSLRAASFENTTAILGVGGRFVCPSHPRPVRSGVAKLPEVVSPTNYAGNMHSGSWNGTTWDGLIVPARRRVTPADVSDGLSSTAMFSEIQHPPASETGTIGRFAGRPLPGEIYELTTTFSSQDAFADHCAGINVDTAMVGAFMGQRWYLGMASSTMYTHQLPPGSNSCDMVGTSGRPGPPPQHSAYTAGSHHVGGVHVVFGDGSARFVASTLSRAAWRAHGTRNGGETP